MKIEKNRCADIISGDFLFLAGCERKGKKEKGEKAVEKKQRKSGCGKVS